MKGIIIRILENDYGQEYGFINANGADYYFDDRYLSEGTMADFYIDDPVVFDAGVNPYNSSQKVAKNVKLNLSKIQEQSPTQISPKPAPQKMEMYIPPVQEESNRNKWYKPGRPKNLELRDFSNEETVILDKLSKVLYHSNAGHFKTRDKGINYGYSLFGPTKQFVLRLGLDKVEFAAILCNRTDFQRRTLSETISHLSHIVFPEIRLIGHFYVLITKYSNIAEQISSPDVQRSLPYSIIPFSYEELLTTPESELENLLLQRFIRFLFDRNFFSYSEPINDRLFLFGGRESYAKTIADRCMSGDHSGIFGLRKSGKTSVINAVTQELDQRGAVYLAYRCPEFNRKNWVESIKKIVDDIYSKLEITPPNREYTEGNAIDYFCKDVSVVVEHTNINIIIIFDEIEQITVNSTFDDKWQDPIATFMFWSAFITFCEKHPGALALLIAGINPSISELYFVPTVDDSEGKDLPKGKNPPRNPLYEKLSNDNYLKPFVFEQTRRMVNGLGKYMGFKFDDDVCFELQKDFGGHPYFTRQMCKTIVEFVQNNGLRKEGEMTFVVTRPLYTAVKASGDYEVSSTQWCRDILKELRWYYPDEYDFLIKIANRDIKAMDDVRRSTRIIPHLIGYGLLRFDAASREMEVSIDIVRSYLIKEKLYKKPFSAMSKEEIDGEIQDGIAQCEVPLRKLIADVLLTLFRPEVAADFIRDTPSFQRDNSIAKLKTYTVQQLLDPRLVTIHFSTLTDIICGTGVSKHKKHFDLFANKLYPYTKAEIESYLNNLYVARNAADHHYEVHNEATLENFRASLNEIVKLLRDLRYID